MQKELNEDFDFDVPSILLAHKFVYTPGSTYSIYENGRKISGLVYSISGSVLYKFKDREIVLDSGKMIFLPKNCAYIAVNTGKEDFSHITINFEITGLKDYDEPYEVVNVDLGLNELLERILSVWTEKKPGYRLKLKSVLYEVLYRYFRSIEKSHRTEEHSKVMPAKRILDEKYRENIPISHLAALCGFSETHFRRTFLKAFGYSPTEYRLKKRITLAKELLKIGELSISEIALYIGFEDSNYFSRIFKRVTGITPGAFRKKGESGK